MLIKAIYTLSEKATELLGLTVETLYQPVDVGFHV
jgi:hypothetical protein